MPKATAQPPNTTEESSQNSDMGETKSLSPPTSVSEVSAETESRPEDSAPNIDEVTKMDVDLELKDTAAGYESSERISEANLEMSVSFFL